MVLDGSDPALTSASWTASNGTFATDYSFVGTKLYAAVDGRRIDGFASLAELEGQAYGIERALRSRG